MGTLACSAVRISGVLGRSPGAARREPARFLYAHPERVMALPFAILGVVSLLACSAQSSLLASLPHAAGNVQLDRAVVVDAGFTSGHPVDDVLASAGKTRADAVAVFRYSATDDASIGALLIQGLSGAETLEAVVQHWQEAAVINRAQVKVGGRQAWYLESRSGSVTAVYDRGEVVYMVSSADRSLIDRIIPAMP